ncbi:MAG: porin family protein [Limisphaerales bacterium]
MKTTAPTGHRFRRILRAGALVLGTWLAGWSSLAAEDAQPAKEGDDKKPAVEKKSDEKAAEYNNWVDMSVGGAVAEGDKAQFQRRYGLPQGSPFGGIEDFHWEKSVGKKGVFQIDGRGIFDNHDYSLKLDLSNPDQGYVRGGYKEFRTWYDGNAGFFPQNGQSFSLYDNALSLDHGEAWFEAGLTRPNVPVLTFRYSHQFRRGQEDSLSWGDTSLTGGFGTRNIVPSFRDIDEKQDSFQGDLKHTVGKTDFGVGLRYELQNNQDALNIRQYPGEPGNDRYLTDKEGIKSDLLNAHAFTESRISDKVLFTTGYSFTSLNSDLSGSRIYGASYDPVYDPTYAHRLTGFTDLGGGSDMKQYVMNLNLMLTPWDYFSLVPALKVERQDLDSVSYFSRTDPGFAGLADSAASTRGFVDVSESLGLRYTKLTNWVLYAQGDWTQEQGDLRETGVGVVEVFPIPRSTLLVDTDDKAYTQKYAVGANWYPLRRLNFSAQYYHKIHAVDYRHLTDSTPGYPAFLTDQDFDTDDVNCRVTYRPFNNLTLVTRYDFQLSTVGTAGDALAEIQSAEITSHIFSESVTWMPLARLYLQGSINYVLDQTHTPANDLTGSAANIVLKSRSDYWDASLMVGYALNDKTDLQAQYSYYRANDYQDNSTFSQPYGAGATEHGVTVSMVRRIRQNLRWTLKYGLFNNRDETSGGRNDYDAHLVYSSLQYRF